MARRRRPLTPPPLHYWRRVRVQLYCALGTHYVPPGAFVRYRSGDPRQLGICESCLKTKYGITRPRSDVTPAERRSFYERDED